MSVRDEERLATRSRFFGMFIDDVVAGMRNDMRAASADRNNNNECSSGGDYTGYFRVDVWQFLVTMRSNDGSFEVTVVWDEPWSTDETDDDIEMITGTVFIDCTRDYMDSLFDRGYDDPSSWYYHESDELRPWRFDIPFTSYIAAEGTDETANHMDLQATLESVIDMRKLSIDANLDIMYLVNISASDPYPPCEEVADFITERLPSGTYSTRIPALWYEDQDLMTAVATVLADALSTSVRVNARWIL